ncbi:hypothetical protein [Thiosocius teredinicola]|uniref:hypothetical protein n=1 Tax=Thiosocius teredinicola TaxID=1973002 RepID=UPI000990D686
MSDAKQATGKPPSRLPWRALIVAVVVISGAILTYLVLEARDERPNYYSPARTALVTAKERLEIAFSEEANLLSYLEETHRDLESAIDALDQARSDPSMRAEIDSVRRRLSALGDTDRLQRTTPEELKQTYHEINAEIEALIERLENRDAPQ